MECAKTDNWHIEQNETPMTVLRRIYKMQIAYSLRHADLIISLFQRELAAKN